MFSRKVKRVFSRNVRQSRESIKAIPSVKLN